MYAVYYIMLLKYAKYVICKFHLLILLQYLLLKTLYNFSAHHISHNDIYMQISNKK